MSTITLPPPNGQTWAETLAGLSSGTPQEALNIARQVVVAVLRDKGATVTAYSWGAPKPGLDSTDPIVVDVESETDPLPTVSLVEMRDAYLAWRAIIDAADAARLAEEQAVATAAGEDLPSMAQIEALITDTLSAASNLGQLKTATGTLLLRLCAHLRKRGAI